MAFFLEPPSLIAIALGVAALSMVVALACLRRTEATSVMPSAVSAASEATVIISLFERLGHASERVQLASAAMLIERLRATATSDPDRRMIAHALIAILKEKAAEEGSSESRTLHKFIADNMIQALGARRTTPDASAVSPLAEYDLQRLRLEGVFWPDLDARGVDFYGSSLIACSLRNARLNNAILYDVDLSKAVLHGADLTGANLTKVKLSGSSYNSATKWPAGFDPVRAGAVLKQ